MPSKGEMFLSESVKYEAESSVNDRLDPIFEEYETYHGWALEPAEAMKNAHGVREYPQNGEADIVLYRHDDPVPVQFGTVGTVEYELEFSIELKQGQIRREIVVSNIHTTVDFDEEEIENAEEEIAEAEAE